MVFVDHGIFSYRMAKSVLCISVLFSRVQLGGIMPEELKLLLGHREKQHRRSTQPLLFEAGMLMSQDPWVKV